MNNKDVLPVSTRRRSLNNDVIDRIPVVEAELVTVNQQDTWLTNDMKAKMANKLMDSLPELIGIAQSFVEMKRLNNQTDNAIKLLKQQGEFLQEQAKAFVIREREKRAAFSDESQVVRDILKDLQSSLSCSELSSEVQMELIKVVDSSIKKLLEERRKS